ncbi:MAG: threonine-phosphate decarboxylase [Candidatus Methanogaster sp.]|uniref:Threonine-phosphate decarboxylase n=1 Tax=Candidatus Methanogaster sp. TaxID=3386292 RepID=A0AC61KZ71_9EURY|nr:MAG: threonine-phosphate decarboxylase [ANME-2 cluster archaeon]
MMPTVRQDITRFVRQEVRGCAPCAHGGRIAEYTDSDQSVIDFSANLNPMVLPDIPVAINEIEGIFHYPDNNYPKLRAVSADFVEACSRTCGTTRITAENIVPVNGSSELIRLFAETVIERGDSVIVPAPTFDEYAFQCRLFGADVQYHDYSKILELSSDQISDASAIFLCNPNNPTGDLIAGGDVGRLSDRCSDAETFLFVDEAFIELSDPTQSVAHAVFDSDFIVVLRSLTKVFAVPGLRLGFGIAPGAVAELLNHARLVWNVGAPAEAIGRELMGACMRGDYLDRSIALIRKERGYLMEAFTSRGFSPHESAVNFILVDISSTGMDSPEMVEQMAGNGILVRDCATFRGLDGRYIRVAVRTREENRMLMRAIDAMTAVG